MFPLIGTMTLTGGSVMVNIGAPLLWAMLLVLLALTTWSDAVVSTPVA
jgi:hypothetical protein